MSSTYLEMSPQYHSASSSQLKTSTPLATELVGPSTLAVCMSDLDIKLVLDCSDNLGGRGGRTIGKTTIVSYKMF